MTIVTIFLILCVAVREAAVKVQLNAHMKHTLATFSLHLQLKYSTSQKFGCTSSFILMDGVSKPLTGAVSV